MSIQVGDTLPNVNLYQMTETGPQAVSTEALFSDKKVVLFALPGAFTPTCSAAHVPGFVVKADEIKARGVDSIICTSVNDAWVMDAWSKQQNADAILMLGDGSADFADALGLTVDLTEKGMGVRSRRYAMIVNDGVVEWLGVDEPGEFELSSADTVLTQL
ncbi:peroxiredoxin [Photobacterium sp.]|jgi:peroxiredoxin|uniref:peroxiredoxin n=1 Tax=Photobacterium sp. TaxID=660 RepID=UPI00299CD5B3|nr:peroxiredoxin [Photobacterium sp.]MDX1304673.1 peroxiredoxin [Photobacterium sp.]